MEGTSQITLLHQRNEIYNQFSLKRFGAKAIQNLCSLEIL